ncbi:MAG: shikimate kinase [Bacteroidales bacterium]|nr:shikimate kinase [Bacteroidales bacterium]MCM1146807.1 shikimate kinase [Bacteroidales bacterium]MCM1205695.1 shikimate kinase [Bacillota bacterium]MCM1510776.1 shikimate kinase [Clostridium sp.]
MKRIILIGYMGVGKTTVGKALAKKLGLMFYDLDWYIESRMRKTVKQIFDERGEDGFRKIEHNMLHEVAEFENVIIACGGGTPCFFDNIDYMNRQADTIFLKGSPETIMKHLRMGKGVRPLLLGKNNEELREYIEESLMTRNPFYTKAKHTIEVQPMDSFEKTDSIVEEIRDIIE